MWVGVNSLISFIVQFFLSNFSVLVWRQIVFVVLHTLRLCALIFVLILKKIMLKNPNLTKLYTIKNLFSLFLLLLLCLLRLLLLLLEFFDHSLLLRFGDGRSIFVELWNFKLDRLVLFWSIRHHTRSHRQV